MWLTELNSSMNHNVTYFLERGNTPTGISDLITKCKQIMICSMKYFKTGCMEYYNFLKYKKIYTYLSLYG
jgi:hypothetical protein